MMPNHTYSLLVLVRLGLLAILFVACSAPLEPLSFSSLSPTLVPLPSATATVTTLFTVVPSATTAATLTPELTATPAPVQEPDYAATVVAAKTPQADDVFRSPDGKWTAQVTVRACRQAPEGEEFGYDELYITNTASAKMTRVDSQLQYCGGLGAVGLKGYFWSPNSRYFYYTDARQGVPDGCGYWERPYWYYDTESGQHALVGMGALAQDKARLAAWRDNAIVIWDFSGGEVARNPVENSDLVRGPIAWASDGTALVYLQTSGQCLTGETTLTRLDGPDWKASARVKLAPPNIDGVVWESKSQVRLMQGDSHAWIYDFSDKTLTQGK